MRILTTNKDPIYQKNLRRLSLKITPKKEDNKSQRRSFLSCTKIFETFKQFSFEKNTPKRSTFKKLKLAFSGGTFKKREFKKLEDVPRVTAFTLDFINNCGNNKSNIFEQLSPI